MREIKEVRIQFAVNCSVKTCLLLLLTAAIDA